MHIFRYLTVIFLLFPALTTVAQEAPTGTITTNQTGEQDASIAVRIREILGELGNYEDVTVTVLDGVVTLRGTTNQGSKHKTSTRWSRALRGLLRSRMTCLKQPTSCAVSIPQSRAS
jgi:hypothetical protein